MRGTPGDEPQPSMAESWDGGASWTPRIAVDTVAGDQWFPWADFRSDGSLAIAYDSNENIADLEPKKDVKGGFVRM